MKKPEFNLVRLLETVFGELKGKRVAVFIDLEDPREIVDLKFLKNPRWAVQTRAYAIFYQGLKDVQPKLGLKEVGFYSYALTGGSNLDLPRTVFDLKGNELDLEKDVLSKLDLVLYIGTYSATAPITAIAKRMGFRGATMHGVNEIILNSGLAADYQAVSRKAEAFRKALTRSQSVDIEFERRKKKFSLHIDLAGQEAQKSHGLCPKPGDIANLPAGEIYFVPTGAEGTFPICYEDGTRALMTVKNMRIRGAELLSGDQATVDAHLKKLKSDPATGELGELGLGTQVLPVAGADIQDEKVLGTIHIATGRSDHLGGHLTPDKFKYKLNATHDDILFAPHKTPDIKLRRVTFHRNGESKVVLENYQPTPAIQAIIDKA
jgi:aminopeptidase